MKTKLILLVCMVLAGNVSANQDNAPTELDLLALPMFKYLTKAEAVLCKAVFHSKNANMSVYFGDEKNDPKYAEEWSHDRTIRAELINWLCKDKYARQHVSHWGICVEGAKIKGLIDLRFTNAFFPVMLKGCSIPDGVKLVSSEFNHFTLERSHIGYLDASDTIFHESVFLNDSFESSGLINLYSSRIGNSLYCSGSFDNNGASVLDARNITVKGNAFLGGVYKGKVKLENAHIEKRLDLSGASITNAHGYAIEANHIYVGKVFEMNEGFQAYGGVSLLYANLGASLDCHEGSFINPTNIALGTSGATIAGNVFLNRGFHSDGVVNMVGTEIEGDLVITDVLSPEKMILSMRDVRCDSIWFSTNSYPKQVVLWGCKYNHLSNYPPKSSVDHLNLIHLQPMYANYDQPYEQLATVLLSMGHKKQANEIQIRKVWDKILHADIPVSKRLTLLFWQLVIKSGYDPWHIMKTSGLFLIIFGSLIFRRAYRYNLYSTENQTSSVPAFNSMLYSLDLFLPIINLHQIKYRMPWKEVADSTNINANENRDAKKRFNKFLHCYFYFHLICGWFITTLFVLGFSKLIKL